MDTYKIYLFQNEDSDWIYNPDTTWEHIHGDIKDNGQLMDLLDKTKDDIRNEFPPSPEVFKSDVDLAAQIAQEQAEQNAKKYTDDEIERLVNYYDLPDMVTKHYLELNEYLTYNDLTETHNRIEKNKTDIKKVSGNTQTNADNIEALKQRVIRLEENSKHTELPPFRTINGYEITGDTSNLVFGTMGSDSYDSIEITGYKEDGTTITFNILTQK